MRGGNGEGLNALVFAVAAIGVGVEVADESALRRPRARCGSGGRPFGVFGQGKDQFADAARLGEADGGSGGVADAVDRGFGLFAEANNEQAFGCQAGGGVQQQCFVGRQPCIRRLRGRRLRRLWTASSLGEQGGLGFGVGAFGGLGIDGEDGEEFGFNRCERGERKVQSS